MKYSLKDLPNVLHSTNTEEASITNDKPVEKDLVSAHCRVFGKQAVPVLVELSTRSVYPVKG